MQKNPNDRSLDGKEREQERIVVKRIENSIKKIEFEISINITEKERLDVENEEKKMQIANLAERRDKGKRLIGGAKIIDVFPPKPAPAEMTQTEVAEEAAKKVPLKDFKKKSEGSK